MMLQNAVLKAPRFVFKEEFHMKRTAMLTALLLTLSLALTACGGQTSTGAQSGAPTQSGSAAQSAPAASSAQSAEPDASADQTSAAEPTAEIPAAYREILNLNSSIINSADETLFDEAFAEDKVPIALRNSIGAPDSWGYQLMDVDGDGLNELLLAAIGDDAASAVVCQMYRLADGKAVEVLNGSERNWYELLPEGKIYNQGSSGAAYMEAAVCTMSSDSTELTLVEKVRSDLDAEGNPVWFHTDDAGNETEITEDEATDWMNAQDAQVLTVTYIPFSDYQAE